MWKARLLPVVSIVGHSLSPPLTVYRDTSGQWHVRNHEGVAPRAAAKIEWLKVQMAEAEFEAEEAAQGGQNEMPV